MAACGPTISATCVPPPYVSRNEVRRSFVVVPSQPALRRFAGGPSKLQSAGTRDTPITSECVTTAAYA